MKKSLFLLIISIMLTGCGVGTYSVSSGKADVAEISFTDTTSYDILVIIDGTQYATRTVKVKAYKSDSNIKQMALNALRVAPGKHKLEVKVNGNTIFSKQIIVSTNEHRVIEL